MSIKDSAVVFSAGKPILISVLNTINRNLTISVENPTFPSKVSTCSCICNNLHIIYITFTRLSVFVFITVIDVCL